MISKSGCFSGCVQFREKGLQIGFLLLHYNLFLIKKKVLEYWFNIAVTEDSSNPREDVVVQNSDGSSGVYECVTGVYECVTGVYGCVAGACWHSL